MMNYMSLTISYFIRVVLRSPLPPPNPTAPVTPPQTTVPRTSPIGRIASVPASIGWSRSRPPNWTRRGGRSRMWGVRSRVEVRRPTRESRRTC